MKPLLFLYRLTGIVFSLSAALCLLVLFRMTLFWKPRARIRARQWVTWAGGSLFCFFAGIRLRIEGPIPRGAYFLVCNHLSYVDIFVLYTQVKGVFVSKGEVAKWPLVGFLVDAADTIYIDRRKRRDIPRVNEAIRKRLAAGEAVAVFPEGTSHKGDVVYKFHSPLLDFPAKEDLPVHYVTLRYQTPPTEAPAHLSVCWWGDMTLVGHLFPLLSHSRIEATLTFGPEPIRGGDRKLLADKLQRACQAQFRPSEVGTHHHRPN